MSDYEYVIRDGYVEKVMKTSVAKTPLSNFLKSLTEQAPEVVQTPVLPYNCVRYSKIPDQGIFYEIFCVYSPPLIQTVAWRERAKQDEPPESFTVSWPALLFKFVFKSDEAMGAPIVKIVERKPTRMQDKLFHAALPNVFPDNKICMVPQYTPGNFVSSCEETVRSFYTGQAFNDDLKQWPPGVNGFKKWEENSNKDPQWIEKANWRYDCTFGEWCDRWDR